MAQVNSQIRSKPKITWGWVILSVIVTLSLLCVFWTPKTEGMTTPQSVSAHARTRRTSALAQIEELLRTHPHPDVRGEFYEMVRRGDFILNPLENYGGDAGFIPMDAQTLHQSGYKPKGALTPVMHVWTVILQPEYKARAQLVLYHEFVHYQQWRDGQWWEGDLSLASQEESDVAHKNACMKKWYAEVEVYHKMCVLGRTTGLTDALGSDEPLATICGAKEDAFQSTLHEILMPDGASAGICSDVWSTL
ncbi:MAG: hypothetical protein WC654_04140 [Patescibacteria group bacterium]